ncbi:MAG: hypothetical protein JSV45_14245 [Chromatiales bacterium]|nr:MAG: hypothetical protein JSV45_14245 [Chromatiales bacterium]
MTETAYSGEPAQSRISAALVEFLTFTTFGLAGVCFYWYSQSGAIVLLLLGWVTFGTAFDFLSHVLGRYFSRHEEFLRWYARINFAALCFGIPFTALAGSFVIASVAPDGINAQVVAYWWPILLASLAFGSLFLFARYRPFTHAGAVEFTLDKAHRYTRTIFWARRAYLALALLVGIAVIIEGFGTTWAFWAAAFGLTFIATVPLHIMHKQIPSMLSEAITLYILAYGSWAMFVS